MKDLSMSFTFISIIFRYTCIIASIALFLLTSMVGEFYARKQKPWSHIITVGRSQEVKP